jgi:hypothetical protein
MLHDHVAWELHCRYAIPPVTDEGEVGAEESAEDEVNGNRDNNDESSNENK